MKNKELVLEFIDYSSTFIRDILLHNIKSNKQLKERSKTYLEYVNEIKRSYWLN